MIIKCYELGEGPTFVLSLPRVSKFLYADCEGMYFLIDPSSVMDVRTFYLRYEDDGRPISAHMTYLMSFLDGPIQGFLFWDR